MEGDPGAYILAVVTHDIPCHDRVRLEAIGAKECSRKALPQVVKAGTLAYVRPLTGTGLWMAYVRSGEVLKLSGACAKGFLETIRDGGGYPVYDHSGTGARLAADQNARAGNPAPRATADHPVP